DDISTFTISIAGGTAGVAISAGVNVVNTHTTAFIGDNATVNADTAGANSAQSVHVAAGNDFTHLAVAGTLGVGEVGVSPAGDVLVYATDDSQMTVISGALAGGFVGVGASVGVTVIHKDTRAFIGDGAHVDAKAAGTGLAGVLNGVNNGTSFGATSAHGVVVQ